MLFSIALHSLRPLSMNKFIYNALLAHPAEINETYFQHLLAASRFALRLSLAAAAPVFLGLRVHFLWIRTGYCTAALLIDITMLHGFYIIEK